MNRIFTFLVSLFLVNASLSAQGQILSIEKVKAGAGEVVLVPVVAKNLQQVGAITLFFTFDNNAVGYLSIENVTPLLNPVNFEYDVNSQKLVFTWSNIQGVSFDNNTLFSIKFVIKGCAGTAVNFTNDCEIAATDLTLIPVSFNNGTIISDQPDIKTQPQANRLVPGSTATFTINAEPVTQYQWSESSDLGNTWINLLEGEKYHGVNTSSLTIDNINETENANLYRCELTNKTCQGISNSAELLVDLKYSVNEPSNNRNTEFGLFPNPVASNFTLMFHSGGESIRLKIFDQNGRLVYSEDQTVRDGNTKMNVSCDFLKPGSYVGYVNGKWSGKQICTFRFVKI